MRELENVIERAVILGGDTVLIEPKHLGFTPRQETASPTVTAAAASADSPGGAARFEPLPLAEIEKRHILAVLEHAKGNRTHAARHLQIGLRTLRNKLNEYGVPPKSDVTGEDGEAGGDQNPSADFPPSEPAASPAPMGPSS